MLDNIDWDIKVHDMRSDNQNKSVHALATTLVFNRVSSDHLPNLQPQQSLAQCDMMKLVALTNDEMNIIRQYYMYLAKQILFEFIPALGFLKNVMPVNITATYQNEMNQKSLVIPFPVLMKDEKKYSDIVDVLVQLETWIHDIYTRAGCLTAVSPNINDIPLIPVATPAQFHVRPDQPLSHIPPTADPADPLATVRVPCFGDQLTRVRFAGAKDLRAGNQTAKDRLDHVYPIRIADWHTKRSFLKV